MLCQISTSHCLISSRSCWLAYHAVQNYSIPVHLEINDKLQLRVVRGSHIHTTVLRLCGFCPGQPGWAGTRRNIHPLTPIVVIKYPHLLPPSTSIRGILSIQSTHFTVFFHNLQVFFGLPLGLAPSTLYSIHFFSRNLRISCCYSWTVLGAWWLSTLSSW